ncbi:MAG: flagellar M-ring protein FliF [Thermodesulfobacteriota bacterium]|nr:MAG: flagellar M-ring protein FliF [Thermodesulfobacteriota bacterium]
MPLLDIKTLTTQFRDYWNKLTRTQKILLLGGSIGGTLALILAIILLTRPHWGLLYSGLDEQTSGEIVQYLKQQKIPYKVTPDGSIYVPQEKVPEIRMEIASKGIIGGPGPGFELFEKQKLGITEFQEKVNYQRALEGELARSIKGIKGIKYVRVHLALPKESIFITEEKPPKASVLITLKPGYELTPEEVRGITNLVSGAVPKLKPENVVIIDAKTGKSYRLPQKEELTASQLAYKRKIEFYFKNKIEELLSSAIGYGKAIAQVSVDLSFDKEQIMEETYDPETTAVVSEDIEQIKKGGKISEPRGIAGVKGTLAQKFEVTQTNQTQPQAYIKNRIIRNYEVSKKVRNLEIPPGGIKKISIAVLVDKDVLKGNETAKIERIKELVKGAIGFNPDRGDEVKVEAISFVKPPIVKPGIMDYLVTLYKPLLILLVLIFFFVFVIRPLLKYIAPKPIPTEEVPPEKAPPRPPEAKIEEEVPMAHEIALGIIQSQPERAAMLVKKWLLEESLEERKKALSEAK